MAVRRGRIVAPIAFRQVLQHAFSLDFYSAFDYLIGGRIKRYLAGSKDEPVRFDCLGIWSDRIRRGLGLLVTVVMIVRA